MRDDRPNVLLIAVHDLGTRLGCYGFENVPSENLDRLAEEGVCFTRHFCTAPYCSPSRGSIISGQFPHVNGLMGLVNLGWDWQQGAPTLAKCLGAAGYETHLFGFQHEAQNDHIDRLGFDHVSDRSLKHKCRAVTPLVEEFLAARGAGESQKPFYARVGFSEVHRGFQDYQPEDPAEVSLPNWVADTPGAREDFAEYDGAIREMDGAVGRILAALDTAGLKENTLVIFTTDHGSPFPRAKASLYDAGINTALLMRWPGGGVSGGWVFEEMLSNVDLFPTLLEFCGAEVHGEIQGQSFLPLLQGGEYRSRDMIFAEKNTQASDVKRCVRTERYKYIRNYRAGPSLMFSTDLEISFTRRDMGNDHVAPRPEVELYDLEADPRERNNLAGKPEFATVEQDLAGRLRAVQEETRDPLLEGTIPRPEVEAAIINRAWHKAAARCRYPREGLLAGYDVVVDPQRNWEFAEPRAQF
jgi:N-sulfoglucosamine sulfohydrolase